jgi:hypothetical protein
MNAVIKNATVLKVTTKEGDAREGKEPVTFVSFTLLDGFDTLSAWGYASDFTGGLPAQGDVVDAHVAVRAKENTRNPQYPRLSVRVKSVVKA